MQDTSAEIWKPIPGFEGFYEASSLGRIRSLDRQIRQSRNRGMRWIKGRVLRPSTNHRGYRRVDLAKKGKTRLWSVHILVALAFHGVPDGEIGNGRDQFQINHIDCNPANNRPENLEWVSPQENHRHAVQHGLHPRGAEAPNSKLDREKVKQIRALAASGQYTHWQIAGRFGVDRTTVTDVVRRRSWRHVK